MVRSSISEAFAARDQWAQGKEGEVIPVSGTDPSSSSTLTFSPAMPQHVLSRWPWVSEETVKSIALGQFDIDNLPKLHRSDELRNAYLKRSMKGIFQLLDGGPAEIVVGTSKLQSSFRDRTMFFLA